MIRIVVPIGGEGKRFAEQGYTFPKPLVEIAGRPMIDLVVENLTPKEPHQFIFVCLQEHIRKFSLDRVLQLASPGCAIISLGGPTSGALCTVLMAMDHLVADGELVTANADQILDASMDDFLGKARASEADGSLMTFPSTHPKWSYAQTDDEGNVVAVAEKRPISRNATVGLYYFRRSSDFVKGAEQMILKHATFNGQFYLCPVFNELILMGRRLTIYPITREQMHSLGTPEDAEQYARTLADQTITNRGTHA
jgi:NDP-sugar pyrophosphorylase family protein